MAVVNNQEYIRKIAVVFISLLWVLSAPLAEARDLPSELKGYQGCTDLNRFINQCLPNVSNVEVKLGALSGVKMDKDKHTWKGTRSRPGDEPEFFPYNHKSKRHNQSIQHIDDELSGRYIITSISDEYSTDGAAIQLIKTDVFGSEKGDPERMVYQRLLNDDPDVEHSNHPGGSQLIGNYLFLALETFYNKDVHGRSEGIGWPPLTGVWKIETNTTDPKETIKFQYSIETKPGEGPEEETVRGEPVQGWNDVHQSTAAVTRLDDDTFLLAACVYKECDYINFYKSEANILESDPNFQFIDQWQRHGPGGLPDVGEQNWDACAPQNMNFVVQDDGTIYLVFFGAVNKGIPKGTLDPVTGSDISGCSTGKGYDDYLFVYKVGWDLNNGINLEYINKVNVIPDSYICKGGILFPLPHPAPKLHGLNFLAGSGLWINPDGRNTITFLATEHYDSCGADIKPVNGKTRWGVSSNWDKKLRIDVDHTTITVNEGDLATNTGTFQDDFGVELSASIGEVVMLPGPPVDGTWRWSWPTIDGPDDSKKVTITRSRLKIEPERTTTFNLVVDNVPPAADAGPDQLLECIPGKRVFLNASGSTDPGADTLTYDWSFLSVPGTNAPSFGTPHSVATSFQPSDLGTYEAMVTVTDDDGDFGTDNVVIEFVDTTPPVISHISATPKFLWPPNNKMVPIDVSVNVTDSCDISPVCTISSIESNEPNDSADIIVNGGLSADLRAERLGAGTGRVYNINVECKDAAGNSAFEMTSITVLHDQGKKK